MAATAIIQLDPRRPNLFGTNDPGIGDVIGVNGPISGARFDDTIVEQIFFAFKASKYLASNNIVAKLIWYSTAGSTTGAVVWGIQMAALAAGASQSVLTDTFATAVTTTSTVNGTGNGPNTTTVTISGASLDSLALDGDVQMRFYRDAAAGGDTMSGDALLYNIELSWTIAGGAITNAGTQTDNAVVRWDGTGSQQVVQDSVVTIADTTGNMAGVGTLNTRTIANWVDGPASATSGRIAVYNGTTGKLLQDGTKLEADVVTGPASATTARVATFNGTTGKIIQDGGVLLANLVVGPASATDNAIVRFDSTTGKLVQDSAVTVADTTGSISNTAGSGTVTSTRFIGPATGLRETNGPTDLAIAGIDTQQYLKRSGTDIVGVDFLRSVLTSDSAGITTVLTTVLNLNLQAGGRIYIFEAHLVLVNSTVTANVVTININASGGATNIAYSAQAWLGTGTALAQTASVTNNTSITLSPALTTPYYCVIRGTVTPSGGGNLNIGIQRATSGTVVAKTGSYLKADEA